MTATRPPRPRLDLDAVPAEIKDLRRWVCWRYEQRKDVWTKPPICPQTGRPADSTDPTTWGTLIEALEAAVRYDADGIGFVLGEADGLWYTGADLDNCYDPATGALTEPAATIIRRLDSYSEVSPSGRGVKVLVRGTIPPGRRQAAWGGLYDQGRYFTVTGNRLPGTPATIGERTEVLAHLHHLLFPEPPAAPTDSRSTSTLTDEEVLTRCRGSANGMAFVRLWAGDVSAHDRDDSRADLGLLSMLSFYTQDRHQLDRLFRRSGLSRDKWNRKDYRERTLTKALERAEFWRGEAHPPSFTFSENGAGEMRALHDWTGIISMADLEHKEIEPARWLVDDLLPEGAAILAGKSRSRKSWLALHIALAVAQGGKVLGRLDVLPGRVLYLDLEGNQRRIKDRARAMLDQERQPWPQRLHIFANSGPESVEWPRAPVGIDKLQAWLDDYPDTALVVIDVLQEFRQPPERNVNLYEYDRATLRPINTWAESHKIACLILHHTRKMKADDVFDEISGSSGLISAVSTNWVLARAPDGQHSILHPRGRDIVHDEPLGLRWDGYLCQFIIEGTAEEVLRSQERKAILELLDDDLPRTPREMAEALGKSTNSIQMLLRKLLADGEVDKFGYGKYERVHITGQSGQSGQTRQTGQSGQSVLQ